MQMPLRTGPVRLSAQMAGALSRLQGLLMANTAEVQNAVAAHVMALREAGHIPVFQQLTQDVLWNVYALTALSGLVRTALSGRATPETMGAIVDMTRAAQQTWQQAQQRFQQFAALPEVQGMASVQPMVQAFQPLERVYQSFAQPLEMIQTGAPWIQGPPLPMLPVQVPRATGWGETLPQEIQEN